MIPNFTLGVFSQLEYRGVGDIDDCAVLSPIMAANSVAGWLPFPSSTAFREAAGNPDDPNSGDGLSQDQEMKAIQMLWPKLFPLVKKITGGVWATVMTAVKSNHPVCLSVFHKDLATKNGLPVRHQGVLYWNGAILRFVNPIKKSFTIGTEVSEAFIKSAADAYPENGIYAIIFPSPDEAIVTHPLFPDLSKTVTTAYNNGVKAASDAALAATKPV